MWLKPKQYNILKQVLQDVSLLQINIVLNDDESFLEIKPTFQSVKTIERHIFKQLKLHNISNVCFYEMKAKGVIRLDTSQQILVELEAEEYNVHAKCNYSKITDEYFLNSLQQYKVVHKVDVSCEIKEKKGKEVLEYDFEQNVDFGIPHPDSYIEDFVEKYEKELIHLIKTKLEEISLKLKNKVLSKNTLKLELELNNEKSEANLKYNLAKMNSYKISFYIQQYPFSTQFYE